MKENIQSQNKQISPKKKVIKNSSMPKRYQKVTLLEKAEKAAREKKGDVKIPYSIKIGLRAIQRMHDIAKKCKGSAYDMYMKQK